ncbi:MAG: hypothetical protein A2054_10070 [Deltaproteobacteria bacterium GWA2_55_10]|nr:MAG: hypothetical protein A2054_10070 [Deltaproteobacteria bacterium GWA2_55_10]
MMKKVKNIIIWLSIGFTAAMLSVMFTPLANMMARPLVVDETPLQKTDVIAVLGGGAYPNGVLGGASNERLLRGLILYRQGYGKTVIFTGGSVNSMRDKLGHTVLGSRAEMTVIGESVLMRQAALGLGMSEADTVFDDRSLNTYENLVFVRAYMEEKGLESVTIVTSPTHMRRAELIAKKLGLKFQSAPVADYTEYRRGAIDRLSLFRETLWEYLALVLYKIYGYI